MTREANVTIEGVSSVDLKSRDPEKAGVLRDAESKGGKILVGGRCDEPYFYPTVIEFEKDKLLHSTREERPFLWGEESFAPLRSLVAFDSMEEAIRLANDGPYGLGVSIFGNQETAAAMAADLERGRVIINESPLYVDFCLPVGGVKDSGLYGSTHRIEEVIYPKRVHIGVGRGDKTS